MSASWIAIAVVFITNRISGFQHYVVDILRHWPKTQIFLIKFFLKFCLEAVVFGRNTI